MFDHLHCLLRSRRSVCRRSAARTVRAVSLFVLAFATATLMGCRSDASFDPASAGTFFPLRRGSSWTYRMVDKNQVTSEIVTDRAMGAGALALLGQAGALHLSLCD